MRLEENVSIHSYSDKGRDEGLGFEIEDVISRICSGVWAPLAAEAGPTSEDEERELERRRDLVKNPKLLLGGMGRLGWGAIRCRYSFLQLLTR
jgi:hypothetical protein